MLKQIRNFCFLLLLGLVVIVWYAVFYFEEHQNLIVTFFDVGQGDSVFIEVPGGNQILIDGGPSKNILSKLGRIMPFWDKHLDVLLLTHPHADHLDGLLEVIKRYQIGMVIESGPAHSIPEYQEWHNLLRDKGISVVTAKAGQRFKFGTNTELDLLYPFKNFTGISLKNIHEANVVSRFVYGGNSIMLAGDAEKDIESNLISKQNKYTFLNIDSDILKVGHHGSKTSSSQNFIKKVSPELAIISVGQHNRYGHPHQEVLDRLRDLGVRVLRTDLLGDIKIKSDGVNFALSD